MPESPMTENTEDWPAQRRAAAQAHSEHLAQAQAREVARAETQIAEFMDRMQGAQVPPERLVAKKLSGNGPVRTTQFGWYIRSNRSAAIGVDGKFYLLLADGGIRTWLRGADINPSPPPLVLGASGRDGESITLRDALARVAPE